MKRNRGRPKGYISSPETRLKISLAQKGKPRPYQRGSKHGNWKGDKLENYTSIHSYLRKFKTGICKFCGAKKKTHNALKKGKRHQRKLENYYELCVKCHIKYDRTKKRLGQWLSNLKKTYSHSHPIKAKKCEYCQKNFNPPKKRQRFCSNSCSQRSRY